MLRAFLCATLVRHVACCSYVEVPIPDHGSPNGTRYVIARSNELGNILGAVSYELNLHPRKNTGGAYAYVSVDAIAVKFVDVLSLDGMNEAGLTAGMQTFRESVYEASFPSLPSDIPSSSVVSTLLAHAGNVDEALALLATRRVVGSYPGIGLAHWAIADASGRSVVVEYIDGKRVVYENTPRIMTNDPPLDWHWRNLNTYVNLNPNWPNANDFMAVETDVGAVPRVVGHGWNLLGLPGDSSPPSRFVQMFYLRGYAVKHKPPKTIEDAMVLATGLLNRMYLPIGTISGNSKAEGLEYTPLALLKIPSERRLLVRSYSNMQWREIDLAKLDFTQKMTWPIDDGTLGIKDISFDGVRRSSGTAI